MLRFFKTKPISNLPRTSQMEIVCGDCGGDELHPKKTFLLTDGTCAECGGRFYACAFRITTMLARHLSNQKTEVNK